MTLIIILLQNPVFFYVLSRSLYSRYIVGKQALAIVLLGHRIALYFDLYLMQRSGIPLLYMGLKQLLRLSLSLPRLPRSLGPLCVILLVVIELKFLHL
jgi:hypothetical protein